MIIVSHGAHFFRAKVRSPTAQKAFMSLGSLLIIQTTTAQQNYKKSLVYMQWLWKKVPRKESYWPVENQRSP